MQWRGPSAARQMDPMLPPITVEAPLSSITLPQVQWFVEPPVPMREQAQMPHQPTGLVTSAYAVTTSAGANTAKCLITVRDGKASGSVTTNAAAMTTTSARGYTATGRAVGAAHAAAGCS